MKIYKYEIPLRHYFVLELPQGSEILSFQNQNEKPFIWVALETANQLTSRYFHIIGTGYEIDYNPKNMNYIGTIQMANGNLVWHLFENIV